MNNIINVLSNSEFWLAIGFCLAFSYCFAVMFQEAFDIYRENSLEYVVIDNDELTIGCTVLDKLSEEIGIYIGTHLGEDNNVYSVVVTVRGSKTVYCYHTVPESLIKIEQV